MDDKDNFFLSIPALIVAFSWVKISQIPDRNRCVRAPGKRLGYAFVSILPEYGNSSPSLKNLNIKPLNICSALFLMLFL